MTNLLNIFCCLPYLLEARQTTIQWVSSPRLQRNLTKISKQLPHLSESHLLRYLLTELKSDTIHPLNEQHLVAYTTRFIGPSVNRVTQEMKSLKNNADSHSLYQELYNLMLEMVYQPQVFFANYLISRAEKKYWLPSLKTYIRRKIDGKLCDIIRTRVGSKTYKRTDYGLVVRSNPTQIREALTEEGYQTPQLTQFVLLWECFNEVRRAKAKPDEDQDMISKASPELYEAIAQRYEKLQKRLPPQEQSTQVTTAKFVEESIQKMGQILRRFIDQREVDLNRPIGQSDEAELTLQDTVSDRKSDIDFGSLNQAELFSEMIEFQQFIQAQLQALTPEQQQIPLFLAGLGMKQTPVGKELKIDQTNIGRKYKKLKKDLLKQVVEWAIQQEAIAVDGDALSGYKGEVADSVEDYFGELIDSFFLEGFQTQSSEHQELLRLRFLCQWDDVVEQLPQPKAELEAQLAEILQQMVVVLQTRIEQQTQRPLIPNGPVQQHLPTATELRLVTAPYSR